MAVADEEALGFFNGLSGVLEIRLTEPPSRFRNGS